ncbi:MAG: globin [Parvibaculaceae bacterium]|nr:globin [Parvibaculaceae bacterium]HBM88705.1 globin [Rhodobiaceae bacterium]
MSAVETTINPIEECLERIAEFHGDPTDLVYKRLFTKHPEMRELFLLDRDNSVKGNMLAQVIECFLDFTGDKHYATSLIATEKINHDQIGVPPETFETFFITVVETFREILGDHWTENDERTWTNLIADLSKAVAQQ